MYKCSLFRTWESYFLEILHFAVLHGFDSVLQRFSVSYESKSVLKTLICLFVSIGVRTLGSNIGGQYSNLPFDSCILEECFRELQQHHYFHQVLPTFILKINLGMHFLKT